MFSINHFRVNGAVGAGIPEKGKFDRKRTIFRWLSTDVFILENELLVYFQLWDKIFRLLFFTPWGRKGLGAILQNEKNGRKCTIFRRLSPDDIIQENDLIVYF